ncbi:hypothetical protein GWI33_003332 [Rhynchophorus ferrugineus]|uniref:Uncharacterized protein n=1 Tax=Rhynchophorus ferrugineus TaxID=354439 RepID=A0A834IN23_RHYFE|nr:hypothetical protein GWI33_003332 [Rhynchophorus ferrugineus]
MKGRFVPEELEVEEKGGIDGNVFGRRCREGGWLASRSRRRLNNTGKLLGFPPKPRLCVSEPETFRLAFNNARRLSEAAPYDDGDAEDGGAEDRRSCPYAHGCFLSDLIQLTLIFN